MRKPRRAAGLKGVGGAAAVVAETDVESSVGTRVSDASMGDSAGLVMPESSKRDLSRTRRFRRLDDCGVRQVRGKGENSVWRLEDWSRSQFLNAEVRLL